jgi:hypothetical protein
MRSTGARRVWVLSRLVRGRRLRGVLAVRISRPKLATPSDLPHKLSGRSRPHLRNPRASPPLGVAIVAAIAAGAAFGPVNPIFATVTLENTPATAIRAGRRGAYHRRTVGDPGWIVACGRRGAGSWAAPDHRRHGGHLCRGGDRHVLQPGAARDGPPSRDEFRTDRLAGDTSEWQDGVRFAQDGHSLMGRRGTCHGGPCGSRPVKA